MLSTLIYSSQLGTGYLPDLDGLAEISRRNNARQDITGILLFDGESFFQILEGDEEAIDSLFDRIRMDKRHDSVVKIMSDHSPARKFGETGMRVLDIRSHNVMDEASLALRQALGTRLPPSDRVIKLIRAFVEGKWRAPNRGACDLPLHKTAAAPAGQADGNSEDVPQQNGHCQFALQPIVDALGRHVSSYEALIRSPTGGPPAECFAGKAGDALYEFDLFSKKYAFELAARLGFKEKLSVNLLPMSLVKIPEATGRLDRYLSDYGLKPAQVVIEITEDEAITYYDEFSAALKRLRARGFGLAIDDFGAGFAGLSLLTRFQPEKIKIDRAIVTGIEQDGPRQAIVKAIVECCRSLGITTVAEGVETVEEWCWLQASGIDLFQGYLFAQPRIGAIPGIHWPTRS